MGGDDYKRSSEIFTNDHWRNWYSRSTYEEFIQNKHFASGLLRRTERLLVDANRNELISKVVQFEKVNESALSVGGATLADFKIWLIIGGNVCTNQSDQDFNVLDAQNGKKLFSLGRGEK